jgi:uncharacterized membrane protein YtjA (UPF0391 family)
VGNYVPDGSLNGAGTKCCGSAFPAQKQRSSAMSLLKWALIFFLVSVVAGIFGFTGISAASADLARILFYIFLAIFIVLLLLGITIFRA